MQKKSNYQPLHGILLVNKPEGLTSNTVVQKMRHLYQAEKAGHTGCLDPFATGMLPVCFGEATKFGHYLLEANKSYTATGLLGITTDTSDCTGQIIRQKDNFTVLRQELEAVLQNFSGEILQVPSMYSALKHEGRPLYHYARQGITLTREARSITIHRLQLLDFDGKAFSITIECSKGTYVRNLIEDIGESLGVGAHVTQLHRNFTSGFSQEEMIAMETLQQMDRKQLLQCLLPMDRAVLHFPALTLNEDQLINLYQGRVLKNAFQGAEGNYRLYNIKGEFQGLGILDLSGDLKAKRLLNLEKLMPQV